MDNELKRKIFNLLEKYLEVVENDQYKARCPLCGDSQKDETKKRFYIKFNFDNDDPIKYNCFNCNSHGYLKPFVLRAFNTLSYDINSALLKSNKELNKNSKKRISRYTKKLNIDIPLYNYDKTIESKKKYIEDRLGIEISYKELRDLKCVLNLSSILKLNNITKITCKQTKALLLEKSYVGFVNAMNNTIIYRNINQDKYPPHIKYKIIPNTEGEKFYTIPNTIDILSEETIYINIAEGVYDILGVYFHINNKDKYNQIYVAATDSSFDNICEYYITKGIVGNVVVNIYSDREKKPEIYNRLIKRVKPWVREVNLLYNSKAKDTGVRKEMISLYKANG